MSAIEMQARRYHVRSAWCYLCKVSSGSREQEGWFYCTRCFGLLSSLEKYSRQKCDVVAGLANNREVLVLQQGSCISDDETMGL